MIKLKIDKKTKDLIYNIKQICNLNSIGDITAEILIGEGSLNYYFKLKLNDDEICITSINKDKIISKKDVKSFNKDFRFCIINYLMMTNFIND